MFIENKPVRRQCQTSDEFAPSPTEGATAGLSNMALSHRGTIARNAPYVRTTAYSVVHTAEIHEKLIPADDYISAQILIDMCYPSADSSHISKAADLSPATPVNRKITIQKYTVWKASGIEKHSEYDVCNEDRMKAN
jgi:hypothetical protein